MRGEVLPGLTTPSSWAYLADSASSATLQPYLSCTWNFFADFNRDISNYEDLATLIREIPLGQWQCQGGKGSK